MNRILSRKHAGHGKCPLPTTQGMILQMVSTHGHHMVNNEIRLIICFAGNDGDALYSQQKQDLKLTVAQIMSSLFQNSGLN